MRWDDVMMMTPWDAIGVWLWGHDDDDDDDDVDPMGAHGSGIMKTTMMKMMS